MGGEGALRGGGRSLGWGCERYGGGMGCLGERWGGDLRGWDGGGGWGG